jgi:hypothetical protein
VSGGDHIERNRGLNTCILHQAMAAPQIRDTLAGNLHSADPGSVTWQPGDPNTSLARLVTYVEIEADQAIRWYWRNKRWKSRCSRLIQISALLMTALAGLFPVAAYLLKEMKWPYPSESGLWSSLFVGVAAALIGLDRTFGLSSGWTRYVLTATSIRKLLSEFRMDCALLLCKMGQNTTLDGIASVVQRAKDFRLAVETAVLQETKDWATEFQNSVAQLDKEVKAQVEALKGELEKAKQGEAETAPGSIELSIVNAQRADEGKVQILLDDRDSKIAEETVQGVNTWVHIGVAPGQYRLTVKAAIGGRPVSTSTAIVIKTAEISKAEISLPV